MKFPVIAIVGRPNVGKSTFFNRLLSQRQSIVDRQEGITRDRIYGSVEWCGQFFQFIDTGGYIPDEFDQFNIAVRKQAQLAMQEANLVLFMVDGKEGPTSSDYALAKFVRKSNKPYILAVNKCDRYGTDNLVHQFHEFGLKEPFPISALNGRFTGDLLDLMVDKLETQNSNNKSEVKSNLRLSIVGMPNVGKSSLTNSLLKKERTIVSPIAGTTRDAIDVNLRWYGKIITLVDTAGLRQLRKIKDRIEYYSTVRTNHAISNSNIVLVLIDAKKGFGKQDKTIIENVISKGKGLIIIVNKWDLIKKDNHTMKNFEYKVRQQFKSLDNYPILFISSLTKQRVHRVLELAWDVYERSRRKISTTKLNQILKKIISKTPPPAEGGKVIKIKYATQVSREPVVIAFYTNHPNKLKVSYIRYIENQIRENFNFTGIPIKLSFRRK